MLSKKTTAIRFGENTRKAPWRGDESPNIDNVHHQNIPWLCPLDSNRSTQIVDLRELNIANVVGTVIVFDLSPRPIVTLDAKHSPWLHRDDRWNVRMPTIVKR